MTMTGTVYERVKAIVGRELSIDEKSVEVTEGSSFTDDLNADSLDLVQMIMAFEEEFSTDGQTVQISDEDAGNIYTIKDAVDYLKEHGAKDE